ncbi:MAG: DUF4124 domain-containing protein [Pseudomonadota bacterium]
MRIAILLAAALVGQPAWAGDEVYRWVDKDGVIHYGAQPPNKDAKPAALPEIQTYSNRTGNKALPVAPVDASTKPVAAVKELRITAPVQDEIFRDPSAGISVSVAVLPALPPGTGIVFYLDGSAKNARPSPSTSTTFNGVERGEHSVVAALVDVAGKELLRSPPVIFHSKPATAR